MARRADRQIAVGDRFKVSDANGSVFEVVEIREMIPAPHALIVKVSERKSPALIAVATLLDPNYYVRVARNDNNSGDDEPLF
jgi:hypothetical protein